MPEVLLLGSTDATIAVGDAILESEISIAGAVSVGEKFSISYSSAPVRNFRFADVPAWAEKNGIRSIPFQGYDEIVCALNGRSLDACIVAGWYHMIPRRFRERFRRGCIGFHASLLPQLR